jgi:hypothetical protein
VDIYRLSARDKFFISMTVVGAIAALVGIVYLVALVVQHFLPIGCTP